MGSGDGTGGARGKEERIAVPAMPMPVAILCCVLNFLVPGLGTMIAGFSTFCCSRNEDMGCSQRCGACCISFGIGLLQLILTFVLLIGWIWSCVWGVFFVGMSVEYYHNNPPTDRDVGRVVTTQPGQTTVTTHYATTPQPQPQQPYMYGQQPAMQGPSGAYGQPSGYPPPGAYPAQPAKAYNDQPQMGYGQPQPGAYGQPQPAAYGHPHQPMAGGYAPQQPEPPPPYTEKDSQPGQPVQPSAPPAHKM